MPTAEERVKSRHRQPPLPKSYTVIVPDPNPPRPITLPALAHMHLARGRPDLVPAWLLPFAEPIDPVTLHQTINLMMWSGRPPRDWGYHPTLRPSDIVSLDDPRLVAQPLVPEELGDEHRQGLMAGRAPAHGPLGHLRPGRRRPGRQRRWGGGQCEQGQGRRGWLVGGRTRAGGQARPGRRRRGPRCGRGALRDLREAQVALRRAAAVQQLRAARRRLRLPSSAGRPGRAGRRRA